MSSLAQFVELVCALVSSSAIATGRKYKIAQRIVVPTTRPQYRIDALSRIHKLIDLLAAQSPLDVALKGLDFETRKFTPFVGSSAVTPATGSERLFCEEQRIAVALRLSR